MFQPPVIARNPFVRTLLAAFVLAAALDGAAMAQFGTLGRGVTESPSISGSQRAQIDGFVSSRLDDAVGGDAFEAADAREDLLAPLETPGASPAFRRAYEESLSAFFEGLALRADTQAAITVLRFSGELGTRDSAQRIIAALDHSDLGVRLFAAGSAGRVLTRASRVGPAMRASDLDALIAALGERAKGDGDPIFRSACVRALGAGGMLPGTDLGAQRGACVQLMCESASAMTPAIDPGAEADAAARAAVHAAGSATSSISQVGVDATPGAVRAAVALGADMIALGLSGVIDGTVPPAGERALLVTIVRSGESLLYFAMREHAELKGRNPGSVSQTDLAAMLGAGEDRDFRNAAALQLGPGSPIVTEFGFDDERFVN